MQKAAGLFHTPKLSQSNLKDSPLPVNVLSLTSKFKVPMVNKMLEKSDLQQIRTVIREEISGQTPAIVRKEINEQTPAIVQGIVGRELAPIKKDIKTLKTDVSKIEKDSNIIIGLFDEKDIELEKRVDRLEAKVGIGN